jgi:hypothetical protein
MVPFSRGGQYEPCVNVAFWSRSIQRIRVPPSLHIPRRGIMALCQTQPAIVLVNATWRRPPIGGQDAAALRPICAMIGQQR